MKMGKPDDLRDSWDHAVEAVSERLAELKPKLRGWIHAGSTPLVLAAGIVLVTLAPSGDPKLGASIFGLCSLMLFGVSAAYHRGNWGPRVFGVLKRWDHANIFLLIAGTYTPFAMLLLEGTAEKTLMWVVWVGALLGVLFRIFWTNAPRWLYVPIYIALGWAAVFFIPGFFTGATSLGFGTGVATIVLIIVGGLLYTLGGAIYGFKWPNPSPSWFGFHEVFHLFTILAFASHYTAVSLTIYALR